jgi:parallel beta-helix repeat protein
VTLTVGIIEQGTGTVSAMPPGTPCGPTCTMFPMGTSVLLTPTPSPGLSFIGWSGGGCDGMTGPCTVLLNANTTVNATFCKYNAVVDPTGNDTNAGTCLAPYKTVTKALSVATFGQMISVHPGTYTADSGETYPLVVPEGVALIGDEAALGNGTNSAVRLQGGGLTSDGSFIVGATVVVARKATVAGFLIVDSLDNPAASGVVALAVNGVGADQATVRANTIATAMADGIVLYHGSGITVRKNYVSKNGNDGVHIYAQSPGAVLDNNQVLGNGYGLEVAASADLGGGTSPGMNTFACNTNFDVLATGAITVTAKNDFWDMVPPMAGCSGSTDLCAQQGAVVTTDGAAVKQAPCP